MTTAIDGGLPSWPRLITTMYHCSSIVGYASHYIPIWSQYIYIIFIVSIILKHREVFFHITPSYSHYIPILFPLYPHCATHQAVLIFSAADEVLLTFVLNPVLGEPCQYAIAERGSWKERWTKHDSVAMSQINSELENFLDLLRKVVFQPPFWLGIC
jgi:hypothetical protein